MTLIPAFMRKTALSPSWYEARAATWRAGEREGIEVETCLIFSMI
jgi:hypothetical protein